VGDSNAVGLTCDKCVDRTVYIVVLLAKAKDRIDFSRQSP